MVGTAVVRGVAGEVVEPGAATETSAPPGSRVMQGSGYYSECVFSETEEWEFQLLRRRDSRNYYCKLMLHFVHPSQLPRPVSCRTDDLQQAIAYGKRLVNQSKIKLIREEPLVEPPMLALLDKFMAWQAERVPRPEVAHDRLRRHRGISVNHILPQFGTRTLSSLTTKDAEAFKRARVKSGAKPSTVVTDLATLRDWCRFGVEKGYRKELLVAPAKHPSKHEINSTWFDTMTYVEMRRALRHEDPELFCLVLFCYYTGCRVTEARTFTFEDVIPFRHRNAAPTIRIKLKGKGMKRTVPVLPIVKTIIDRMAAHHGRKTGFVFNDVKKLSEKFHDFLVKEGLYLDPEGNTRHLGSMRHTRATLELHRGRVTPAALAAWMGHTPEQQSKSYSKVIDLLNQEGMHVRLPRRRS